MTRIIHVFLSIVIACAISACKTQVEAPGASQEPIVYDVLKEDHTFIDGRVGYLGVWTIRALESTWRIPSIDGKVPGGKFPLVIYLHGNPLNKEDTSYILDELTSRGIITVAYNFPYNGTGKLLQPWDIFNIPSDVSYLIDKFAEFSEDPDHILFSRVDFDKVGVLGYSYGGVAAMMTVVLEDFYEPRIDAAVSIADGGFDALTLITGTSFSLRSNTHAEALIIQGSEDDIFDIDESYAKYNEYDIEKHFATLEGMNHYGFHTLEESDNELEQQIAKELTTAFFVARWKSGFEQSVAQEAFDTGLENAYDNLQIQTGNF